MWNVRHACPTKTCGLKNIKVMEITQTCFSGLRLFDRLLAGGFSFDQIPGHRFDWSWRWRRVW